MNLYEAFGLEVKSTESLVGAQMAMRVGRTVFVSPAMWSLMRDSKPAELERLLRAIRVVDVSDFVTDPPEPLS